MSLRILAPLIVAALAGGCGTTTTAARAGRVAVLPLDSFGLADARAKLTRKSLSRQVAGLDVAKVVAGDRVDEVLASAGCSVTGGTSGEDLLSCASRVGRELEASHVVFGVMGGLGDTYVLRLKLLSVAKGAVTRSLEETVFARDVAAGDAALGQAARRLFNVREAPWYRRWWVWSLVAATASVAIIVPLATRDSDPYRDIRLP